MMYISVYVYEFTSDSVKSGGCEIIISIKMFANRKDNTSSSSLISGAMNRLRKEQTDELFRVNRMKRLFLLESTSGKNSTAKSVTRGTMEPESDNKISEFEIDHFQIASHDLGQAIFNKDESEVRLQLRNINKNFNSKRDTIGIEWNKFSDLSFQQNICHLLTPGNIEQQETLYALSM